MDCLARMISHAGSDEVSGHCHRALTAIAPHLTPGTRQRAVHLAHALEHSYETAGVLADLAAHADPGTQRVLLHEAASVIRTLTRAYELEGPLTTLAPHLDENEAAEFLACLLKLVDSGRGHFPATISRIAPGLTPALLEKAANAVRKHPIAIDRAKASKVLAQAADAMHPCRFSKIMSNAAPTRAASAHYSSRQRSHMFRYILISYTRYAQFRHRLATR